MKELRHVERIIATAAEHNVEIKICDDNSLAATCRCSLSVYASSRQSTTTAFLYMYVYV